MASPRKVKLLGGALALFVSQAAMAVGLGDIKLNSALNEPLAAEIELLNIGDLSDLEMLVGLAGRKDFERAGVIREFFLTGLQFSIDLSGPKPKVLVKTQKPVREPYLDFLVEMQWPTGRLLKEYTVLVDLPVYAEEKPQAKAIDNASSSAGSSRQPAAAPQPSRPVQQVSAGVGTGGDYRVRNGDTLWGIARRSRPQGASIHQAMVAIYELNPSAFVKGDINILKRGEVLRLPANHQITASHSQAVDAVAAHQQPGRALMDAVDTEQSAGQGESGEPQGRLKLFAALDNGEQSAVESDSYSATENEGSQQGGGPPRELLENELIIAQEELARKNRELDEYKERLAMLEEQLETTRLIDLQSDQVGAAQVAVSQAEGGEAAEQQQNGLSETASEELAEAASDVAGEADSTEPAAAATVAEEEPGQDFWGQYKYYLMSGIGVLVLLLILLAMRRNRQGSDNSDDLVFDDQVESVFAEPEVTAVAAEAEREKLVPVPETQDVDLSEDDQLFAAEALDMEEPADQAEQADREQGEEPEQDAVDSEQQDQPEMLPTLDQDSPTGNAASQSNEDDLEVVAESSEGEGDFDLDIDGDEIATKLDLAKAYSDVGDKNGAREMLEEVVQEGNEEQQQEAKKLLDRLSE